MGERRFSNQTAEQILSHLRHFLDRTVVYDLRIDPLNVNFFIRESTKRMKGNSEKRSHLREQQIDMKQRERILSNTKKRVRPKIRSIKKGRTVSLKGRIY